jgi:hypothetical protein
MLQDAEKGWKTKFEDALTNEDVDNFAGELKTAAENLSKARVEELGGIENKYNLQETTKMKVIRKSYAKALEKMLARLDQAVERRKAELNRLAEGNA